jgi:coniferyl-aldehyde dehydrogenase
MNIEKNAIDLQSVIPSGAAGVSRRQEMLGLLERQREAYLSEGAVSAAVRKDRIDRLIALVLENQDVLVEAISKDFGHRSRHQSQMSDIYATVEALKAGRKGIDRWMKPEKRKMPFPMKLFGARGRIEYQPKGVIGNIATWNFPVLVSFNPLAGILAAGNRAMIKLSEFVPATNEVIIKSVSKYFDPTEVVAIDGGPEVGAAFASLPFDHIVFTGAASIGRHIMRAAADNLTPVTLELGGKSPVIIDRDYKLEDAAWRIMSGKSFNVGQVCLAPDYIFVPEELKDDFVRHIENVIKAMFPTMMNNPDYTSIINRRHFDRIKSYVDDAKRKGADVRVVNPGSEHFDNQNGTHKLPFTLIINPGEDAKVMQEELFGPIIPIKSYRTLDEVIRYINAHPRPLGLYYFGHDAAKQRQVLDRTTSGGVTINDVTGHASSDDLPLGGIGASGMGAYHGIEGFKTFSHAKSVCEAPKLNLAKLGGMLPPYGPKAEAQLKRMLGK